MNYYINNPFYEKGHKNMDAKSILLSKTVWLAILQGLLGVVVALGTQLPTVGWIMVVKSVIDVLLRVITEAPVKFSVK